MSALTPTKVALSEFSGDKRLYVATFVPASASDTITFVAATNKFRTIYGAFPFLETGMDAALQTIYATFSALVVTVVTKGADGANATDWTGATARLLLVVGGTS